MEYKQTKEFIKSLRNLNSKGGQFKKAAERIMTIIYKVANPLNKENPLKGTPMTNHGENRIKHCVKYDLTGASRLITTQHKGVFLFCFAGDHSSCDAYLDKNRGMTPIVDDKGKFSTVQISSETSNESVRITGQSALTNGFLYELISENDYELIIDGLSRKLVREIEKIESINDENEIFSLLSSIDDLEQSQAIYDIFSLLRQNKTAEANKRINHYLGRSIPLDTMDEDEIKLLANSESIQAISTSDPNFPKIFQHFVETSGYMDWMLFMHPDQTDVVDSDFNGPSKLFGVSGSGKTCVVVKRAIRLAEKYKDEKILILTLNKPLAVLIRNMIEAACLEEMRSRIIVEPFFKLCQKMLHDFEPYNDRLYDDTTWKSEEHIDEIWREFYRCELNNIDATVLHNIHDSLISRKVSAEQYIKEEFDWIRSAVSPANRESYLAIERKGRSYPFDSRMRRDILKGLSAWERKMRDIGITDYLGIATALYNYLDKIKAAYRCVLIDEAQDFGTIELEIIRTLSDPQENDLFLCGDAVQQVTAKHQSFKGAGIDIHASRITRITKNYRNSYEILTAAETLLIENFSDEMESSEDFKVLDPEYADFSSSIPLILKARNLEEEIAMAIRFSKDYINGSNDKKACIAFCGYSLFEIQSFGQKIKLPVLDGSISIDEHNLYLSDLEQTKGFEFDVVCIVNCTDDVIPNPLQPEKEQFRDLSRFYVAMTRAKMQLTLSFSGIRSKFIDEIKVGTTFQDDEYNSYVDAKKLDVFGVPLTLKEIRKNDEASEEAKVTINMSGPEFLYTRDALGLDKALIEKLRVLIPGTATRTRIGGENIRVKWKNLKQAMNDILIHPASRNAFGPEGVESFKSLLKKIDVEEI